MRSTPRAGLCLTLTDIFSGPDASPGLGPQLDLTPEAGIRQPSEAPQPAPRVEDSGQMFNQTVPASPSTTLSHGSPCARCGHSGHSSSCSEPPGRSGPCTLWACAQAQTHPPLRCQATCYPQQLSGGRALRPSYHHPAGQGRPHVYQGWSMSAAHGGVSKKTPPRLRAASLGFGWHRELRAGRSGGSWSGQVGTVPRLHSSAGDGPGGRPGS